MLADKYKCLGLKLYQTKLKIKGLFCVKFIFTKLKFDNTWKSSKTTIIQ